MMNQTHISLGATLAPDGIPLHYGDQRAEYDAALTAAVLMDRSHEGRFVLNGRDRLALPQRMSTNDLLSLTPGLGAPTLFTNPNGRIIDRAVIYAREDDALVLTEAGRGPALRGYIQRNVFFNDDVQVADLEVSTRRFSLHGPNADQIVAAIDPEAAGQSGLICTQVRLGEYDVALMRSKPVVDAQWVLIVPSDSASAVFETLLEIGRAFGLRPAGSLTYNALRIRAGRPAPGRELSSDYIPLEVGLWDEISFQKGCYTGQEIIARMESRGKLAKTIVTVTLDQALEAPLTLFDQQKQAGTLTSAVETLAGERFGIAIVRVAAARVGNVLHTENGTSVTITSLAGEQPIGLLPDDATA